MVGEAEEVDGWISIPHEAFSPHLRNRLTVYDDEMTPHEVYEDHGDRVLVPRSCARYAGLSKAKLGVLPDGSDRFDECAPIDLRDYQIDPVDDVESYLRGAGGVILQAEGGRGKTVMAIEVIRRLATPTVVLVHKEFLAEQWIRRIVDGEPDGSVPAFMPKLKVGMWQGDRCDALEDYDVVIAVVQSLTTSDREYPKEAFDRFGLLIADECHRYGADTWRKALTMFPARYKLGLSATPNRRDGMDKIVTHHIGPIGVQVDAKSLAVEVRFRKLPTKLPYHEVYFPWNGEVNWSGMQTSLSECEQRTDVIVRDVGKALKSGRKVMVLSHRINHVNEILHKCEGFGFTQGEYVGGMNEEERFESAQCDLIVGTFSQAQEGLDIPDLDTLVLSTPQSSIEQAVWRISRDHPGKKDPMVVDYVDSLVEPARWLGKARLKRYRKLNVSNMRIV